jgi:hypothetical protein
MRKIYCNACGIEIPKTVLEKNSYNYWNEFLDLCPTCGVISTHAIYFCKFKGIFDNLKKLLEEVKRIKENTKCESDMESAKPLKVIIDINGEACAYCGKSFRDNSFTYGISNDAKRCEHRYCSEECLKNATKERSKNENDIV